MLTTMGKTALHAPLLSRDKDHFRKEDKAEGLQKQARPVIERVIETNPELASPYKTVGLVHLPCQW